MFCLVTYKINEFMTKNEKGENTKKSVNNLDKFIKKSVEVILLTVAASEFIKMIELGTDIVDVYIL